LHPIEPDVIQDFALRYVLEFLRRFLRGAGDLFFLALLLSPAAKRFWRWRLRFPSLGRTVRMVLTFL
jgi:hypothetical protein